jgi:hypothetical protein
MAHRPSGEASVQELISAAADASIGSNVNNSQMRQLSLKTTNIEKLFVQFNDRCIACANAKTDGVATPIESNRTALR